MKISIITVSLNNRAGLEATIKSVLSQTYHDLEYIIIDGGSTDGTLAMVATYQDKFPIIFIAEPDRGIYDAMNKGLDLASGDWLNFMNAGDWFYRADSVQAAAPYLDNSLDIVYGNTEIRYGDFTTIKTEPRPDKFWRGRIPHQSAFIKTATMKKYRYNPKNKIVADLEFFLQVYYHQGQIKKIDQTVASFAKDGITETQGRRVIAEAYRTVKKFQPGLQVDFYYSILKIKPWIKGLLPKKLFKFIKTKSAF